MDEPQPINPETLSEFARDLWERQIERLEGIGATIVESFDSGTSIFISYVKSDESRFEMMIPKAGGLPSEADARRFAERSKDVE